mmetsp:Transcript_59979/g.128728  ORF Transcript_59979/g.128728 Transcript_59979/m.128728 type:complete len:214 (+) Transcript_59979:76-717(+)
MMHLVALVLLLAHLPAFVAKGEGDGWHLAPPHAVECDFGTIAPQAECQAAVAEVATQHGQTPRRNLQTGHGGHCGDRHWGGVPRGCTSQSGGDWAAHFKTSGPNCNNGVYRLVCSGAMVVGPLGDLQRERMTPSTISKTCTTGLCEATAEWMLFYSGKTESQCQELCQDGRRLKPVPVEISDQTFYAKTGQDDQFLGEVGGAWPLPGLRCSRR